MITQPTVPDAGADGTDPSAAGSRRVDGPVSRSLILQSALLPSRTILSRHHRGPRTDGAGEGERAARMLSSLRCCRGRLHLPPRAEARKMMSATRFSPDPCATMPGEALGLPIAKSARTQDRAE